MRKSFVLLITTVLISLLFSSCGILSDHLSKDEIFRLVRDNETILLNDIAESNFEKASAINGIIQIDVKEEIIDFYCGGAGLGSSTSYYGFYYTANDNITAIWCSGESMVPDGDGYLWAEEDGDNRYYTEKICDCFYYYEAHF